MPPDHQSTPLPTPRSEGGACRPVPSTPGDYSLSAGVRTPPGHREFHPPGAPRWSCDLLFACPRSLRRSRTMMYAPCLKELRDGWFPHTTDAGLDRLIGL